MRLLVDFSCYVIIIPFITFFFHIFFTVLEYKKVSAVKFRSIRIVAKCIVVFSPSCRIIVKPLLARTWTLPWKREKNFGARPYGNIVHTFCNVHAEKSTNCVRTGIVWPRRRYNSASISQCRVSVRQKLHISPVESCLFYIIRFLFDLLSIN